MTALLWWVVGGDNNSEIFTAALHLLGHCEDYGEPPCGWFLCDLKRENEGVKRV